MGTEINGFLGNVNDFFTKEARRVVSEHDVADFMISAPNSAEVVMCNYKDSEIVVGPLSGKFFSGTVTNSHYIGRVSYIEDYKTAAEEKNAKSGYFLVSVVPGDFDYPDIFCEYSNTEEPKVKIFVKQKGREDEVLELDLAWQTAEAVDMIMKKYFSWMTREGTSYISCSNA